MKTDNRNTMTFTSPTKGIRTKTEMKERPVGVALRSKNSNKY